MSGEFADLGRALAEMAGPLPAPIRVFPTTADAKAAERLGLKAAALDDPARLRLMLSRERPVVLVGSEAHACSEDFWRLGVADVVGQHLPLGSESFAGWLASELKLVDEATVRSNWLTLEGSAFPLPPKANKPTVLLPRLRRSEREQQVRLLGIGDLLNRPAKPWLVKNILGQGDLGVIVGQPGAGKSFVALSLGLAIADGRPWLERQTTRGPVVYVCGEGASGMGGRIRAALGTRAQDELDPVRCRFRLLDAIPNLLEQSGRDPLLAALLALEEAPAMVILDTWARVLGAAQADENSTQEASAMLSVVDEVRSLTGAATLVVHHPSKAGENARGSTSLPGAADAIWTLRRESQRTARLSCTKSKDAEPFQDRLLRLEPVRIGSDEEGQPLTTLTVVDGGNAPEATSSQSPTRRSGLEQVREALEAAGELGLTLELCVEVTGLSRTSAYRHLRTLAAMGSAEAEDCSPMRWRAAQ